MEGLVPLLAADAATCSVSSSFFVRSPVNYGAAQEIRGREPECKPVPLLAADAATGSVSSSFFVRSNVNYGAAQEIRALYCSWKVPAVEVELIRHFDQNLVGISWVWGSCAP